MAKPIKTTPILKGQDATKFLNQVSENSKKTASPDSLTAIRNGANKLNSILKIR